MAETIRTERPASDQPFLRAITFSYLLATGLLAAFAIGSYAVLQEHTKSEATSAAQINISGSQRMLSQKIAILGNRLVQSSRDSFPTDLAEAVRTDLLAAAGRMEQSHQALIGGDPARHLPTHLPDAVRAIYFDGPESLDMQLKRFVAAARALAASSQAELTLDNEHLLYINDAAGERLLAALNALVRQYQRESEANITRLQQLQRGATVFTLAILLLLALFVFRPMVRRIRDKINALLLERSYSDSLLETTQVIVLVLERDATIRYFNPYMEQLSGYPLEEVRGKSWLDTFIPDNKRSEVQQFFMQALSDIQVQSHINPVLTREGRERMIEWHNKILTDLNGRVTGMLATGIDITDRMRDEETLRQSEEKFRLLFEASGDGIFVLDMEGKFIDINRIFHELLGYTREEMMAKGHIAAVNTPEAAEVFIRRMSELERLGQARFESIYQKKYGTVIPVEVNARLIHFAGRKFILGTIRDITARKHLEMELSKHRNSLEQLVNARTHELSRANRQLEREIAERRHAEETIREMAMFPEMNPAPVLRTDGNGLVDMANRAAKQLCEGKKILGASIFSLCPELKRSDFDNLFTTDRKIFQFETEQHEKNFVFSLLADPQKSCAFAYGADITHIKQLERQVRQSQKMDAMGQLAGGIAHDFNSLLGVILGFGDMMRDHIPADDSLRDNLEEIMIAGSRAKELVRELMDFSRPDGNNRIPLQLDRTVKESIHMLRAALPASITIHTDIRSGEEHVLANASQIGQLLMNLGINAGDAIGSRTGRIDIELDSMEVETKMAVQHEVAEGPYLRLTVRDSGCGMNRETMARIFEPFFTTKAIGKGTGLGLAVVHGIVHRHHGFVDVKSRPGEGSRFHIYLPVAGQQL